MCKANDIYIPVLVGNEREEIVQERQESVEDPEVIVEEEEGCDVITWVMIATSILLLIATVFMPCGCEVVHAIEGQGSALLRGAANIIHPNDQQQDGAHNFQLSPSEMTPLVVDESVSNGSIEEDSLESSENTSADSQDDEEFHIYSGLPNDESSPDDAFDYEMVQESEADDDEVFEDEEESTKRTSAAHKRPPLMKDAQQTIFSSAMVDHVFVSDSGSDNADDLLESRDDSPSRSKETTTSHVIPSDDKSANAKQSSNGAPTKDDSPKSYSVSFDEVFKSAPSDDDEGIILEEPTLKRRSLGGSTN